MLGEAYCTNLASKENNIISEKYPMLVQKKALFLNTYSRIISTAASYLRPSSINANATKTGARPRPATQCTATQASGFS